MNKLGNHLAFQKLANFRPCWKKERHDSEAKAKAAIRSLEKRGLTQPEKGTLHAYVCQKCGGYHTGHFK